MAFSVTHGTDSENTSESESDANQSDVADRKESSALATKGSVTAGPSPALFHKVKNQRSILALAISASILFAGTQGGEILVRDLESPT